LLSMILESGTRQEIKQCALSVVTTIKCQQCGRCYVIPRNATDMLLMVSCEHCNDDNEDVFVHNARMLER